MRVCAKKVVFLLLFLDFSCTKRKILLILRPICIFSEEFTIVIAFQTNTSSSIKRQHNET